MIALVLALLTGASATAPVKGPVTVRMDTIAADVEVVPTAAKQVTITVSDGDAGNVRLVARAEDRLDVEFDGRAKLRSGHARLEVPRGSGVDIKTISGELQVGALGGDVRFRSMSGDARVTQANNVELSSVSGEVEIKEATGTVRIRTVSGDVKVAQTAGAASQLEFESTSGDLSWSGACGAKCRITGATVSGDVQLALDGKSSFDLKFQTHSGDFEDHLGMGVNDLLHGGDTPGRDIVARYGKGEGVIEVHSFSGDLSVRKR